MRVNSLKKIGCVVLFIASVSVFESCRKSTSENFSGAAAGPHPHVYGLNPMTEDEWINTPIFPEDAIREKGLAVMTLPSNYLLTTPAVRDQGQTGCCTGFCGAETNEILNYYKNVTGISSPTVTVANAMSTANSTKFSSPTTYFGTDGALSPLFIYYVERCVIEGKAITSDPGANMVNIGEVLQGLKNNTGSTATLTLNGKTYKGTCTENLYPYPTTVINAANPYNLATSSSPGYAVVPSTSAISDALNFDILAQSGTTGSTGITTHGYYLINSTGDTVEVNNVKLAIANNKPVMMGFNVYDNSSYTVFEGLTTSSYIYDPLKAETTTSHGVTTTKYVLNTSLTLEGGHAVPLIGYVNDGTASTSATGGGYFIVQNSWGTPWGYNGDFLLPYSVLRNSSVVGAGNLYVVIP